MEHPSAAHHEMIAVFFFYHGCKADGKKTGRSPTRSGKVSNVWSVTSNIPYCLCHTNQEISSTHPDIAVLVESTEQFRI